MTGEDLTALWAKLSPDEREGLEKLFAADAEEQERIQRLVQNRDYKQSPVSPQQFLTDPDYFGHIGEILWDRWWEDLVEVMEPKNEIVEWILTGAIGIGKTTVSIAAMGYKIHRLLCLRDPYSHYGQARINRFYFGLYNVYKYKGREMYDKLKAAINASPWFQSQFPTNPRKKDVMEFPETITVIPGASEIDALGENLVACHLSEVNFMRVGASVDDVGQAWKIYNNATRRIKSRFMFQGHTPGILILDSSRRAHTDMLEEHLKEVRDDPHVKISEGAIWDYRPKKYYTGVNFRVLVGDQVRSSEILPDGATPPPDVQVIDVPVEYREDFERDIDGALRDIAGIATFAVLPFMPNRELLMAACDPEVSHPFSQESICVSTTDQFELIEFLVREKLVTIHRSRYRPRLSPGALRFAHIDLSRNTDCAGFAMGYVEGNHWTKDYAPDVDAPMWHPVIRIEAMLRILPPPKGEIDYSKIRRFLSALRDMGYQFGGITFDGFQSVDMIQILTKAGFPCAQQSMDRLPCVAYQSLRSAVTEQRIKWYHYPPFLQEVSQLQKDVKGKVDHPPKGSKDVADCVAGVVNLCCTVPAAVGEPDRIPQMHDPNVMVPVHGAAQEEAPFHIGQLLGSGYKG